MTLETAEQAPALLQLDADTATVVAGGLSTLHGSIRNESSVAGHDPESGAELWQFPWDGSSGGNAHSQASTAHPERDKPGHHILRRKSAGANSPRSGCCQRISVSMAMICFVARSNTGPGRQS